jgi:4-carboxymuconolactone decarboxylase|tara:strand:- start:180867 stop:181247 length:381 start_codon:yes stop_codon:yes gene_type:complete
LKKDELYERGRAMRQDMFGEPGVRGIDEADDFTDPLQDLVTRLCFGDVWSRPGLDRRTRSMLTIAMLIGQSRPDQLRNHVKGALANGVTKEELREILVHASIYTGLPSVSDSWRHVRQALEESGAY